MSIRRVLVGAAVLLALRWDTQAQRATVPLAVGAKPTPAAIQALLASSNAQQQAWGAWFAGARGLPETIPLLSRIVEDHLPRPDWRSNDMALDAALHALIQLEARVPPDLVARVYKRRAAQAFVLLARLGSGGDALSLDIVNRERGIYWFTAANLLLAHKTPGTAAVLLRGLEILARLRVSGDAFICEVGQVAGGVGVGDGGSGRAPGYPPIGHYELTISPQAGTFVLAPGPRTILCRHYITPAGETGAGSVVDLNGPDSGDRLLYLAALLGTGRRLPLNAYETWSIPRRGGSSLPAAADSVRQLIIERYSALIRTLEGAQLLTREEALELAYPRIEVHLTDQRQRD